MTGIEFYQHFVLPALIVMSALALLIAANSIREK